MFDIRGVKSNNVTLYKMFCSNIRITYLDIKKTPKKKKDKLWKINFPLYDLKQV